MWFPDYCRSCWDSLTTVALADSYSQVRMSHSDWQSGMIASNLAIADLSSASGFRLWYTSADFVCLHGRCQDRAKLKLEAELAHMSTAEREIKKVQPIILEFPREDYEDDKGGKRDTLSRKEFFKYLAHESRAKYQQYKPTPCEIITKHNSYSLVCGCCDWFCCNSIALIYDFNFAEWVLVHGILARSRSFICCGISQHDLEVDFVLPHRRLLSFDKVVHLKRRSGTWVFDISRPTEILGGGARVWKFVEIILPEVERRGKTSSYRSTQEPWEPA